MWRQNQTFRELASGSWLALLQAVTLDPAMLLWLDQTRSRRRRPNENYAREAMELFTLGEGPYTESDIAEAARAFTGLILNRATESGEFRPAQHDPGTKTVLGRTGRLRWSDVIEVIVQQPQADLFITAKLWNFFAGQPPSAELNAALAARFRESGGEFKPLLRSLFRSAAFYHQSILANQVKSPAQWLVASLRALECPLPPPRVSAAMLGELGQELFAPPNVKGWDGGVAWITTNTLLARYNRAAHLVYGRQPALANRRAPAARRQPFRLNRAASPVDPERLLDPDDRQNPDRLIAALQRRLLMTPLKLKQETALREYLDSQADLDDGDVLEIIRLIMSTPEYQVT
jgi:uncharacterized protein (DUF1800 family)